MSCQFLHVASFNGTLQYSFGPILRGQEFCIQHSCKVLYKFVKDLKLHEMSKTSATLPLAEVMLEIIVKSGTDS